MDWLLSLQDLEIKFQQEKEELRISWEKKVVWFTLSSPEHSLKCPFTFERTFFKAMERLLTF